MSYYRKYRSQKFADLIGQDHIRDTLLSASQSKKIAHAYLFTGPRGTGKTSTARLIAKAVNCLDLAKNGEPCGKCASCKEIVEGKTLDVIEIDAASNRGIDEIRTLRENVKFPPVKLFKKIYIIDEIHMLTREAFNALLKTLEEPPAHLIFILATTEAHKLPATIISRTQRFDFHRVGKKDIIKNLKKIAAAEGIEADDKSFDLMASMAEGSHRDAITFLEQAASFSKKIDQNQIESILGLAKSGEIGEYIGAIFNSDPEEGLKIAHRFFDEGFQLTQINFMIIDRLRQILLYLVSGEIVFEETEENIEIIKKLAGVLKERISDPDRIVTKMIEIFLEAGKMFKDAAYPVLPLEMATIKASALINPKSPTSARTSAETGEIRNPKQIPHSQTPERSDGGQTNGKIQNPKSGEVNAETINPKSVKIANDQNPDEASKANEANVAVVEMSDDTWQAVVLEAKKTNSTLAALLRDATPIVIENDVMTLGVKFKFHHDKISEMKNLAILEAAIEQIMGKKIKIKCKVADLRKKPKQKLNDEELAKAAEEIFSS